MDMGIIASIKVGYKYNLLHTLLSVFDDAERYKRIQLAIPTARRGYKGIVYGLKPNILDCMNILVDVWIGEQYCSDVSIGRCWRRANCLPLLMQQQLHNDFGSANIQTSTISKNDVDSVCNLLSTLCVKVKELPDVPDIALGINEMSSFSAEQRASAVELWCDVESDPMVVEAGIEEAKERFEALSIISLLTATVDDDDLTETSVDTTTTSSTVTLNQFHDAMRVVYDFTMQSSCENAPAVHYNFFKNAYELTKCYSQERTHSLSQRTIQHFFSVRISKST